MWTRVELGLNTFSPQLLSTVTLSSEWAECNQSVVKAMRRPASQQPHSRLGLYNCSQLSDVVTFSSRTPLGPANEVVSLIACLKIHTGRALVFRDHCKGSFCERGICVSPQCLLNDRWYLWGLYLVYMKPENSNWHSSNVPSNMQAHTVYCM